MLDSPPCFLLSRVLLVDFLLWRESVVLQASENLSPHIDVIERTALSYCRSLMSTNIRHHR